MVAAPLIMSMREAPDEDTPQPRWLLEEASRRYRLSLADDELINEPRDRIFRGKNTGIYDKLKRLSQEGTTSAAENIHVVDLSDEHPTAKRER